MSNAYYYLVNDKMTSVVAISVLQAVPASNIEAEDGSLAENLRADYPDVWTSSSAAGNKKVSITLSNQAVKVASLTVSQADNIHFVKVNGEETKKLLVSVPSDFCYFL